MQVSTSTSLLTAQHPTHPEFEMFATNRAAATAVGFGGTAACKKKLHWVVFQAVHSRSVHRRRQENLQKSGRSEVRGQAGCGFGLGRQLFQKGFLALIRSYLSYNLTLFRTAAYSNRNSR